MRDEGREIPKFSTDVDETPVEFEWLQYDLPELPSIAAEPHSGRLLSCQACTSVVASWRRAAQVD